MSNDIYDLIDSIAADQSDPMLIGRLVRLKVEVRKAMEGVKRARTDSDMAKVSAHEFAYVERVRNCLLFTEHWIHGGYVRVRKHDLQRVLNRLTSLENERTDESLSYSMRIGNAGQRYMDRFPYAHPLPVQFRWSELWEAMLKAARGLDNPQRDATEAACHE